MIPFCGVVRPMAPPAAFLPCWAGQSLAHYEGGTCWFCCVALGLVYMGMVGLLVMALDGGWESFPFPTLSRTIIDSGASLTSLAFGRDAKTKMSSLTGFLESKDNMNSYLAMARHFPKLRSPGPGNVEFPEEMSESQEIFQVALSGLISVTSSSHDC